MTNWISGIILKVLSIEIALAATGGTSGLGGTGYTGGTGGGGITLLNPLGTDSFGCLVQKILAALFTLSIPICSIMVMVGGYFIMSAAGDEEKLKKGRNTIAYAAIGFAVILIANGVAYIIASLAGTSIAQAP